MRNPEELIRISLTLSSALSDLNIEIEFAPELAQKKVRYVHTLLHRYPNTEVEVTRATLDAIWDEVRGA